MKDIHPQHASEREIRPLSGVRFSLLWTCGTLRSREASQFSPAYEPNHEAGPNGLGSQGFIRELIGNRMSRGRISQGHFSVDNAAQQDSPHRRRSIVVQTDMRPLLHHIQGETKVRQHLAMTRGISHNPILTLETKICLLTRNCGGRHILIRSIHIRLAAVLPKNGGKRWLTS